MLKSLHIRSFRGLEDVQFDDLRSVNILVGENNSGKTSVLEAIMLAMAPGDNYNWFQILQARDSAWNWQSFGEMAKWLFPVVDRDHLDERKNIEIEAETDETRENLRLVFDQSTEVVPVTRRKKGELITEEERLSTTTLSAAWSSTLLGDKAGQIIFQQVPSNSRYSQAIRIDKEIERIPALKCVLVKPQAHRFGKYPVESLSAAIKAGEKEEIVTFLKVFDENLEEIDIVEERSGTTIYVQHRTLGPMPIHAFGDGMRKAVVVAGMAFEATGGLLLLDEAEVALHVTCQDGFFQALFDLCERLQVQVVLTTHSLEAVDGVIRACSDVAALAGFHLPDRDSGQTVKRMSGDIMERLRFERGLDLR